MKELQQSLDWDVQVKEIKIPGTNRRNRFALTKTGTGELIGIRSNRYYPVYNKDMEMIKERILETNGFTFKGYQQFSNGKRLLAFFENKRKDLQLGGQDVKDYLIIGNSHDTTSKLFIGTSNYMFRCENQFSEKIRSIEWKHNRPFDIEQIQIEEVIQFYEIGRRELYRKMERLKEVEADMELIHRLARQLMGTNEKSEVLMDVPQLKNNKQTIQFLNCIEQEVLELGPTLWGVFNGVTRYTSNYLKGNPGFGVVNGKGEQMNRELMEFCLSHC